MALAAGTEESYVDFPTLLAPTFSPHEYANKLIISTNNPTDTTLDLSTPLSRVLFDVQEVDTHIHNLTTKSAIPILEYTKDQNKAAQRILAAISEETSRLNSGYERLEREVLTRYESATKARLGAERSWQVLRLGRNVQRVLGLARQLEASISEANLAAATTPKSAREREDHHALVRASYTVLSFRDIMTGPDAQELGRINLVKSLRGRVFEDNEERIRDWARRAVREFVMNSLSSATGQTFKEVEDAKSRITSAAHILFLLSPTAKIDGAWTRLDAFEPELLLRALHGYLQTAITSSSASIARALSTLPTLERTLLEVSARCQNIVALEALLRGIAPPEHPLLSASPSPSNNGPTDDAEEEEMPSNLLKPLLHSLDTSSLPSYFWRSLASSLSPRVQEILNKGGVSARTLRTNRDKVREELRECVMRGSQVSRNVVGEGAGGKADGGGGVGGEIVVGGWEREAAVMIGSVIGVMGR